jgi:hypothetical protein
MSYRQRMPIMVSEELPTEDALSGCRGVTDRECSFVTPLKPQKTSSIRNSSETRKGILRL